MPPIQTSAVTPNSNFRSFGRPFESLRMKRPKKRDVEIQTKRIPSRELTIISHLGKRKIIIFKHTLGGDTLVPRRVSNLQTHLEARGYVRCLRRVSCQKLRSRSCSTSSSCSCSCSWTCSCWRMLRLIQKSTDLSKGKKTPAVMVYRCFQK